MNQAPAQTPKYPPVQVTTPMPAGAPATLSHRGQVATLPVRFDHATATYLLSLFDYPAAQRLCDGEHFEPLPMTTAERRAAVGFVSVVDYHQTDVGPYREWILAFWVMPRGGPPPVALTWVNLTSLGFYAALAGDEGFTAFSPKMILSEQLPTEVGREHYGIPKEVGQVTYERTSERTQLEAHGATGEWVMRASVPTSKGGFLGRCRFFFSLTRAFGLGAGLRLVARKEMPMTLAGSARLCPKKAFVVSKVDPQAAYFPWDDSDCQLAVNPQSEWGKKLQELQFAPALVAHIPNLAFVFSGPMDQAPSEVPAAAARGG